MAINELHSRLEYLVSYSSQLIFISCESLSQQQSSLQQFIAKQHENTEVAFINGESTLRDSDYRNEIYRQLVSHPLSPNVPLDEQLIQHISKDAGPILLCICAAQHISTKLLNELWSLVLKNKDLQKGHHLNVLLFGSPEWTESAKSNLAKDNQHLPILLSSEIVTTNQFTQSYSQSISQKRAEIDQRFKTTVDAESESIITKPLFKILAGMVFLGIFSMLVFWQYPNEIKQFVDPHYTVVDEPVDELAEEQVIDVTQSLESIQLDDNMPLESDLPNVEETEQIEQIEQQQDEVSQSLQLENSEQQLPVDHSQELVTSWQQEVEKQQLQVKQEKQSKQAEQQERATKAEQAKLVLPPAKHPILELDDNLFVLQLASMSDPAVAERFITQHGLQETSWIYTTQRFGGDWHVVIFKKTFANVQQARQYTASLPDSIDKTVPFAKSVKQIKVELAVPQQ
ncbi:MULTISPECIES: SPOR domain-containing protein [Alteromonadaceae]|uniref:SPOR domain-containing protein n=1 Tax=Alteromonadaceae TaxID=72275 RepID=UPI00310A3B6C